MPRLSKTCLYLQFEHNSSSVQRYNPDGRGFDSRWCQPYHLHVSIVLKSVSLNLLEPSGSVQASNGIALPLLLSRKFTLLTDDYHILSS